MADHLREYAESQGLNPLKAGEVLLNAASSGGLSETGEGINVDCLIALGVTPEDTRWHIIGKLTYAVRNMRNPEVLRLVVPPEVAGDSEMVGLAQDMLRDVIDWVKSKEETFTLKRFVDIADGKKNKIPPAIKQLMKLARRVLKNELKDQLGFIEFVDLEDLVEMLEGKVSRSDVDGDLELEIAEVTRNVRDLIQELRLSEEVLTELAMIDRKTEKISKALIDTLKSASAEGINCGNITARMMPLMLVSNAIQKRLMGAGNTGWTPHSRIVQVDLGDGGDRICFHPTSGARMDA